MTWEGEVTKYHKAYRRDRELDRRIGTYIQYRVLKISPESLTLKSRRGIQSLENGDLESRELTTERKDFDLEAPRL